VTPIDEPDNRPVINITNDVDFLAAIPSMVGLVPNQDLIAVTFTEATEMISTMRIGSRAKEANIQQMLQVIDDQAHTMIAVIVDTDIDIVTEVAKLITLRLGEKVRGIYAMPTMTAGSYFIELGTGQRGTLADYLMTELAMLNTMDGKILYNSPSEIDEMYTPLKPLVEPTVFNNPKELTDAMERVGYAIAHREPADPADVGGIITFSEGIRDEVLNFIEIDAMDTHTVFTNAARYLRGPARIEALTVAGIAAYLAGEGLLTAAAFEAAFRTAELSYPPYEARLAQLVSEAYHQGMHPKKIRELVIKDGVKKIRDNQ
jgi:hypothetical protein